MNERVLKCLYDIKSAIEEIDIFLESNPTDFYNYKNNTLLKRAIERNLEIIGEAISRILREDPDFQIKNARRIVGLRNQITHGYDSVSDESIWGIIVNHIPNLKKEINKLIE